MWYALVGFACAAGGIYVGYEWGHAAATKIAAEAAKLKDAASAVKKAL